MALEGICCTRMVVLDWDDDAWAHSHECLQCDALWGCDDSPCRDWSLDGCPACDPEEEA